MELRLTPVQIAILAMAHDSYEHHRDLEIPVGYTRHPDDVFVVWGSWQLAASRLYQDSPRLLSALGVERGTRELEWSNLGGRYRRGKPGRTVHTYRLALCARPLAARCAYAVKHLPPGRRHATWKDVPEVLPTTPPLSGHTCPECGCEPGEPCTIKLRDGCGLAFCVPAGTHNLRTCSACLAA